MHSSKPSFKLGVTSVLTLIATLIGTFLPQLHSKNIFQSLFYITLALVISLLIYVLGIIFARMLDVEKYELQLDNKNDKVQGLKTQLGNLNKNIEQLKEKIRQLEKENREISETVEVEDPQRNIKIKINGKPDDNPVLKELISQAIKRYQTSDKEQKKKWEQEWEDKLINGKW